MDRSSRVPPAGRRPTFRFHPLPGVSPKNSGSLKHSDVSKSILALFLRHASHQRSRGQDSCFDSSRGPQDVVHVLRILVFGIRVDRGHEYPEGEQHPKCPERQCGCCFRKPVPGWARSFLHLCSYRFRASASRKAVPAAIPATANPVRFIDF